MTAAPGSTASRTWAAAVVATMLLIGGCSDDGDSPTRVLATGQQDLPPAVRAAVDGPMSRPRCAQATAPLTSCRSRRRRTARSFRPRMSVRSDGGQIRHFPAPARALW
ncbi:hypothetical protein ACETU7_05110 [Rhodococcus sp. 3Y1]